MSARVFTIASHAADAASPHATASTLRGIVIIRIMVVMVRFTNSNRNIMPPSLLTFRML